MALDLEAYLETRVIRRIQYALDCGERERRHFCEHIDEVVKDALERRCAVGNPRDQAPAMCFRRGNSAAEHDHGQCSGQPGYARYSLSATPAGDLAESDFRKRQNRILGGNANITCHSQLETNAHGVFFKHANDRLRTTLRCGNIPCKVGHAVTLDLRERLHVAARPVHAVFPADYNDAHFRILRKLLHDGSNLTPTTVGT